MAYDTDNPTLVNKQGAVKSGDWRRDTCAEGRRLLQDLPAFHTTTSLKLPDDQPCLHQLGALCPAGLVIDVAVICVGDFVPRERNHLGVNQKVTTELDDAHLEGVIDGVLSMRVRWGTDVLENVEMLAVDRAFRSGGDHGPPYGQSSICKLFLEFGWQASGWAIISLASFLDFYFGIVVDLLFDLKAITFGVHTSLEMLEC